MACITATVTARQLEQDMTLPPIEKKNHVIIWTPELDAYVDFWRDRRKSFTWIADNIGVTRCSVIGRAHRRKKK